MGMVGAAIMTDFLVRGIGPAVGGSSVPGGTAHPAAAYSQQDFVNG